jgi:hypothetical protein
LEFPEFLRHYLGEKRGDIVYLDPTRTATTSSTLSAPSFPSKASKRLGRNNEEASSDKENPKIVLTSGQVIGKHNGFWYYTIGQRKDVVQQLHRKYSGIGPFYVLKKDTKRNIVFVTNKWYEVDQSRRVFRIQDLNWLVMAPNITQMFRSGHFKELKSSLGTAGTRVMRRTNYESAVGMEVQVKTRHSARILAATVFYEVFAEQPLSPSSGQQQGSAELQLRAIRVQLKEKDMGLAPGQFAVIYLGDYCLVSGVICNDDAVS